jgi:streptogramin lyase
VAAGGAVLALGTSAQPAAPDASGGATAAERQPVASATQRTTRPARAARVDHIRGTVTSGRARAEAGVWVIAEGKPGNTPMRKIVVTDGRGRFVLPELPNASYRVWVRGYGLVDSKKTAARPGATLSLRVRRAATRRVAAQVYPANYWLSMLNLPDSSPEYANQFKLSCMLCHQIGIKSTRLPNREAFDHGTKKARTMYLTSLGLRRDQLLDAFGDWGRRISEGQTPGSTPPRPRGKERNIVITQWNWGDRFAYAHDEISTDKRNPRRNANGPVWGVDIGNDRLLRVDPKTNRATTIKVPTRGGYSTPWCDATAGPGAPPGSAGFGTLGCPAKDVGGVSAYEGMYKNPANPHNPMLDAKGRVWVTTQIRREWPEDIPAHCRNAPGIAGRSHHRQLGYYDPKTKRWALIDTCFGTHHLQFDRAGVLWTSGDSYVFGWFDPAKYDPARPETEATAQGFAEVRVDSDGDQVADRAIVGFNYGIIPSPDGTVWSAQPSTGRRGTLVRYDPRTGRFENYVPPAPGSGPRGVDTDSKGIIWAAMGGSGHLGRFDRSKCTRTWGDGTQCAEGWTFYKPPGPMMAQSTPADERTADLHYYLFVDQHNTFGMGKDVVILNGTNSDSLQIFDPKTRRWTTLRIPYPLNAYQRGLDGRIDDPKAGWKGRGLWFNDGLDPIIHNEIQHGWLGHAQMRPSPLAR